MKNSKFVAIDRHFAAKDAEREERIRDEITVDAHGDSEVATSWYYYLEEKLDFPFEAMVYTHKKRNPPNSISHSASKIRVLGLAPLQRCSVQQIWAMAILLTGGWETPIHILLTDLNSVEADETREEALSDWMYWNRHHDFGLWELK